MASWRYAHDSHTVIKNKIPQASKPRLFTAFNTSSECRGVVVLLLATFDCRRVRVPKWQPSVKDVRATNLVAQSRKWPKSVQMVSS